MRGENCKCSAFFFSHGVAMSRPNSLYFNVRQRSGDHPYEPSTPLCRLSLFLTETPAFLPPPPPPPLSTLIIQALLYLGDTLVDCPLRAPPPLDSFAIFSQKKRGNSPLPPCPCRQLWTHVPRREVRCSQACGFYYSGGSCRQFLGTAKATCTLWGARSSSRCTSSTTRASS